MAIEIRSPNALPPPYLFNDVDEVVDSDSDSSPEIPMAELPSPPTAWIPASDMNVFGARPLFPEVAVVQCKDCDKPIMASAISEHTANCEKIRNGGAKKPGPKDDGTFGNDAHGKKRKADELGLDDNSANKKKKKAPAPKTGKTGKVRIKAPIDPDKQCGVFDEKKSAHCSRSITCKVHSMQAKRALPGRSKPYDELLLDWRRIHDPNFREPVKKETKAEKKEKRDREREAKRAADIAAGIIVPKKKSKKATAAAAAAAAAASTAGGANGPGGANRNGDDDDDLGEVDSEAEADALIEAVQRGRTITAIPLARPLNGSSYFITRNENLRCCADIMLKALQRPTNSSGGPNGNGAVGLAGASSNW